MRNAPNHLREVLRELVFGSAWLLVGLAGCSDKEGTTDVSSDTGLQILSGANQADTIGAFAPLPLVVSLVGVDRKPLVGVAVRFTGSTPLIIGPLGRIQVDTVGHSTFDTNADALTDSAGKASVAIRFGGIAGAGFVTVSVPTMGLQDTARFTVKPGAAVAATLAPRDTAFRRPGAFRYRGTTIDRVGNVRNDPGSFTVVGNAVVVDNNGSLTAREDGSALVIFRSLSLPSRNIDTATVAVVPTALIAYTDTAGFITLGNLLMSTGRLATGLAVSFEPGNNRLVMNRDELLTLVDRAGALTQINTPNLTRITWPEFSPDGQWIYFQANSGTVARIYRIRPNGSGLEAISVDPAQSPTVAPDSRRVAYMSNGGLTIHDLSTGERQILPNTTGVTPRWSPTGEWIAFATLALNAALMVVRPDGSGLTRVGQAFIAPGIGWSPDSRFIVAAEPEARFPMRRTFLVDVNANVMARLPFRSQYPTWSR